MCDFIEKIFTNNADTLYILGDLFEYWIGDDGADTLGYTKQMELLAGLSTQGKNVFFLHGNRDFLVGPGFSQATGVSLLPDPAKIELAGYKILLKHGDDLCTDDIEHQKFRVMTRDQQWQQTVLSKSIDERLVIASQLRQMSGSSYKSSEIMDANEQTIKRTLQNQDIDILIHGHTHRPATHEYSINNRIKKRIVLGDWQNGISYLKVDQHGFELIHS